MEELVGWSLLVLTQGGDKRVIKVLGFARYFVALMGDQGAWLLVRW